MTDPGIEILLNRRGGPRWEPLTRDNTTSDGWAWGLSDVVWDALDWGTATYLRTSIWWGKNDKHLRVYQHKSEISHRVRGKRCTILGMRKVGE